MRKRSINRSKQRLKRRIKKWFRRKYQKKQYSTKEETPEIKIPEVKEEEALYRETSEKSEETDLEYLLAEEESTMEEHISFLSYFNPENLSADMPYGFIVAFFYPF